MPRVRYLVAYDIEDDGVRQRIASVLERAGWRVQRSVFECSLDTADLDRLTASLASEMSTAPGGDVRLYRLCSRCLEASFGLGDLDTGAGGRPWQVV